MRVLQLLTSHECERCNSRQTNYVHFPFGCLLCRRCLQHFTCIQVAELVKDLRRIVELSDLLNYPIVASNLRGRRPITRNVARVPSREELWIPRYPAHDHRGRRIGPVVTLTQMEYAITLPTLYDAIEYLKGFLFNHQAYKDFIDAVALFRPVAFNHNEEVRMKRIGAAREYRQRKIDNVVQMLQELADGLPDQLRFLVLEYNVTPHYAVNTFALLRTRPCVTITDPSTRRLLRPYIIAPSKLRTQRSKARICRKICRDFGVDV